MGVVTSARSQHFEAAHAKSGVIQYMDFVLTREDYTQSKPHPEPYLTAMDRHGPRPEECIRQAFAQYGDVATVNVIMDRETGRPRGFAFVEMPNGSEAKEAIEKLNEAEIAGRAVIVNEARPKQDRPRGGDGGHRGGGGGRGRW